MERYKEYLPDRVQMKTIDSNSIEKYKVPSLVLMERAALSVCELMSKLVWEKAVCVCSTGNNGADGLCIARIMKVRNKDVDVIIIGDENKCTKEFALQKEICQNIGVKFVNQKAMFEYDIIVDAIFGIGLTRDIEGEYEEIIQLINKSEKTVIAVDMPSGIDATDGKVKGVAAKADYTVTFGYKKLGLSLNPGRSYCGEIVVAKDVGFYGAEEILKECSYTFNEYAVKDLLPERKEDSNKGDYGRILVIAGSKNMSGAALFSGKAALKTGAGLVKIMTHSDNRNVLMTNLPEAIYTLYDKPDCNIEKEIEWADIVIVGPGISMELYAVDIVLKSLKLCKALGKITIVDADALNICAGHFRLDLLQNTIITPHLKEASRLTGKSVSDIKAAIIDTAKAFAEEYGCISVFKDSRTIVTDGNTVYVNATGNSGMATGGSGDVLTGIIAGIMAQNKKPATDNLIELVSLSVWIHGACGDICAKKYGKLSMTASSLLDNIYEILI